MMSSFKILCGIGLVAIFSSTISKNPSLPLLIDHLSGDHFAIGLVAAVSALTGILFSFPAGILSDKIGRYRMLLVSGFIFATAPFLYLFADEIWQIALIRFYHGLATAIFGPVAMALVADLYQESRGEKMGWFSTATLLGRFSAPATGGAILAFYGSTDAEFASNEAFSLLYVICGVSGLFALAGIFILSKDKQKYLLKMPAQQQATHPSNNTSTYSWWNTKAWRIEFCELLSEKGIMITCVVEASILFSFGIFETFLPIRGLNLGLSPWDIGLCLSSQIITIAISKPVLGRFSDQYGRPPQIIAGTIFASACMLILAYSGSFWSILAGSILFGLAISIVTSASAAYIADLSKKGSHGSAMGMLGSIMDIGHTAGPLLGGIIAISFGLSVSFISASIVLIMSSMYFMYSNHSAKQN